MKKAITILLALVMALSLAACGGGSTTTNTPAPTATTAPTEAPAPAKTEETPAQDAKKEIPQYDKAAVLKDGECGESAKYTLYDNGVLVISGKGIISNVNFSMFNDYVKYIKIEEGITETTNAFKEMKNLELVELPDSIKVIGVGSFSQDSNLAQVNFPEGLERIEKYAFYSCNDLRYIEIPASVKTIGEAAFQMCWCKELILHNGIQQIGVSAFSYNDSIELVYIPGSVEAIGDNAFRSCDKLSTVVLGDGVKWIGSSAFQNIKVFAIPDSVESIGISKMGEPNPTTSSSKVYCNMDSYAAKRFTSVADVIVGYDGFMKDFDSSKYE